MKRSDFSVLEVDPVDNLEFGGPIASAGVLPEVLEVSIEEFIKKSDAGLAELFSRSDRSETEVARLSKLWSSIDLCGKVSARLVEVLAADGISARQIVNDQALSSHYNLSTEVIKVSQVYRLKRHVLVAAEVEDVTYHIDPTWQQFLGDVGVDRNQLERGDPCSTMPEERVLAYRSEDVPMVGEWFSLAVRTTQNRHKTHLIDETDPPNDMFSRTFTLFDMMKNAPPPAEYYSMSHLESMANQIWNPAHYRELESTQECDSPI
jgi:hypothetical protein